MNSKKSGSSKGKSPDTSLFGPDTSEDEETGMTLDKKDGYEYLDFIEGPIKTRKQAIGILAVGLINRKDEKGEMTLEKARDVLDIWFDYDDTDKKGGKFSHLFPKANYNYEDIIERSGLFPLEEIEPLEPIKEQIKEQIKKTLKAPDPIPKKAPPVRPKAPSTPQEPIKLAQKKKLTSTKENDKIVKKEPENKPRKTTKKDLKIVEKIRKNLTEYLVKSITDDQGGVDEKKVSKIIIKGLPKKKKPNDPRAPKRPCSAYIFFTKDMRSIIKKKYPDLKTTEIVKKMGEKWRGLSDLKKEKWNKLSQEDKERYKKEYEEYEPSEGFTKKYTGPKKPNSAYIFFSGEFRPVIKQENPEFKFPDISRELGRLWKNDYLDIKKRKKWIKMAEKDKERYTEEMKALESES